MGTEDLIDQYAAHLRETDHSKETIHTYRRTLLAIDGALPYGLDGAHETEIKGWLWRDGLAPASRSNYHAAINGFYAWAVEADILISNPCARIKAPKVPKTPPRVAATGDVQRIVTEASYPYRLWGIIAAYEGARTVEIFRMQREDITQQITNILRGKGDKGRAVPTHPVVWSEVEHLPPGPLVTGYEHQHHVSTAFWAYANRRLKMRGMSLHRLRGWWATTGYHGTKDLLALQLGMGHDNPAQTARYINVADTALQNVVDSLPTFG